MTEKDKKPKVAPKNANAEAPKKPVKLSGTPAPATKPTPAAKPAVKTEAPKPVKLSGTPASATKPAPAAKPVSAAKTVTPKPVKLSGTPASATKPAPAAKSAPATKTAAKRTVAEKTEQPKKERKQKSAKSGDSGKGGVLAAISPKTMKIILSAVALLLVVVIVLGIVFGVRSCSKNSPDENGYLIPRPPITDVPQGQTKPIESDKTISVENASASQITGGYDKGTARAPQIAEYLGSVDQIVKPIASVVDEHETYGVKQYPTYGKKLTGYTVEERNGLIKESHALAPWPTWKSLGIYDAIDSEGYLLRNKQRVKYTNNVGDIGGGEEAEGDVISGGLDEDENSSEAGSSGVNTQYKAEYRMLYKHTAALTHFGGGLSDDEPRIVKKITAVTHTKLESTHITGLYAPAGEVIKIEMSKDDYYAAGGIRVLIGQNYNLYQHVSMETSGDGIKGNGLTRMPDILSIFQINNATIDVDPDSDTVTAYVGSFIGGPIYFRPINNGVERKISVTFSGAVKYQHFILGVTTPEEYEFNKASTAPYFDLEVYDSVRFTTTKYASSGGLALKDFTYENCTDAAILWDKIAEVSTRVAANGLSASSAPIYIIGDCYIAAGAAFANPGRNGVVCPPGWLAEALNYNRFVNSGSWGTMHEYNHCWQGYGVGNGGEVTNNATTLVAYSLYTRISQSRTAAPGWGNGGWNRFTDPSKALGELLSLGSGGGKRYDLSLYATLLHNIGQDNFVAAARGGREAGSTVYYRNLVNASHYDMTYYFTEVLNYGVAETLGGEGNPGKIGNLQKSVVDDVKAKNYPVFVPVASVYQVGRSILRDGKTEYITTAQPFSYGSGEFTMDFNNRNNFKGGGFTSKALVIPDGFTVTVKSVTQPQNGTVTLLQNNQVKYTPSSGKDGLYSGNFKVTLGITKNDNAFTVEDVDLIINLKQSTNTNLNRTTYTYNDAANVPDTASVYNAETKTFDFGDYAETETRKNVCTQETNTQIWGAGRNYNGSTFNENDYKELEVGKTIQTLDGTMYFSGAGTYRFTLKGRGKATLYLSYDSGETWESALTIDRSTGNAYVATEYSEHEFTTKNNYVQFKVVLHVKNNWQDFFGIGVSSKQADGTFSAFANAKDAFTNPGVHNATLEDSAKKFETEYHFKNQYGYSYSSEDKVWASGTTLVSVSHKPWDNTRLIDFMFDGKSDTWYHSEQNVFITEEKPLELVVDFGSVRKVNTVTFNGYKNAVGNNGMVKTFKIYGSTDGETWSLVTEQTDSAANAKNMTFSFNTVEIRYYKLVVTKTDNGRYFAMNSIVFSYNLSFPNGKLVAPNEDNVTYSGQWGYKSTLSNFGTIYTAGADDSVEFAFTGSRFAYFASHSAECGTVDIYLDGKLVAENIDLSANNNAGVTDAVYDRFNVKGMAAGTLAYMYTGDALEQDEHVVKIVGKSGTFNVDSFAYWD